MAFWGIEVKPAEPFTLKYEDVYGKLIMTQATLGSGPGSGILTKKSILQCCVGDRNPVYLCTLLPGITESCSLNLEFEEDDDVEFSVVGPTSIHLSGFIQAAGGEDSDPDDYEYDSYGEDIAETESDESSDDYSNEDSEDDFIVDDDRFPDSLVPKSGVVIEEIIDDDKPGSDNGKPKQSKTKKQSVMHNYESDSQQQLLVRRTSGVTMLESEDEDGFPIASSHGEKSRMDPEKSLPDEGKKKNKRKKDELKQDGIQSNGSEEGDNQVASDEEPKSKVKPVKLLDNDAGISQKSPKKKKMKMNKEQVTDKRASEAAGGNITGSGQATRTDSQDGDETFAEGVVESEGKKKKKKKKNKGNAEVERIVNGENDGTATAKKNVSAVKEEKMKAKPKPGKARTFANGLVIEELEMGKPDGKRASAGKKVSVRYIGRLKKNNQIFDSNTKGKPFKFLLGVGQVIKGWDVGFEGMRVGDKRRLIIPPSMGYGTRGAPPAIPPNAWLVFDVELVDC